METKRSQWGSSFGFLMAAIGSAVGLGNLWGFPYKMGRGGGFAFVIIYLIFAATLGFVGLVSEMALGRKANMDAIGSYTKIDKSSKFVGIMAAVVPFIILTFYCVLGGWVLKYIFAYVMELFTLSNLGFAGQDGVTFFTTFIASPFEPVFWFAVFLISTGVIVALGVEKGIEKSSKIMMPMLFVMITVIVIRSVTLPGAMEGVKFILKPDFSVFSSFESIVSVSTIALSQVFFSLSIGMGIMITYGSYLGKDQNIEKSAIVIPIFDTLAAMLAGLAIMPAVFAFGLDPSAGPGLMFITLKEVFNAMPLGNLFGLIFFFLVFFAAISSSISLLEVVCAYFIDTRKMPRKKATTLVTTVLLILGIPVALTYGTLAHVKPIMGMDILDSLDFISEYTLMPLGAMLMCLLIGWKWKPQMIIDEVEQNGVKFKSAGYYSFLVKTVTPLLIAFILYKSSIEPIINYIKG